MGEGDTGINAFIGGIVTFVIFGFIPFAPVLGGAISGYLQGGSRNDGLKVGLYAGLIALIPAVVVLMFAGAILGAVGMSGMFWMGGSGGGMFGIGAGLGILVFFFVLIFGLIYIVGLSAIGGWIGNYVKQDTDVDI